VFKAFFKWLFRIKPEPVKVEPVVEDRKPTPGEESLDVALAHINRMKPILPGFVEKPVRPRVTGMSPAMAMPYKGNRQPGLTPEEVETNRARSRARNHAFATQYTQPATPQDRTVDDLVMMASAIGMSSAFSEGRRGDEAAMNAIHDANIQRMGVVESGGDLAAKASEFAECIDRASSHRETPSASCYTPSRSEPEPSRYEPTPSEPASSSSSNDSYGD
jgi:hypothetical protein